MMLKFTESYLERANWLKDLEAKEALALIRSEGKDPQIDFELFQLCPESIQKRLFFGDLMQHDEKKNFMLW